MAEARSCSFATWGTARISPLRSPLKRALGDRSVATDSSSILEAPDGERERERGQPLHHSPGEREREREMLTETQGEESVIMSSLGPGSATCC